MRYEREEVSIPPPSLVNTTSSSMTSNVSISLSNMENDFMYEMGLMNDETTTLLDHDILDLQQNLGLSSPLSSTCMSNEQQYRMNRQHSVNSMEIKLKRKQYQQQHLMKIMMSMQQDQQHQQSRRRTSLSMMNTIVDPIDNAMFQEQLKQQRLQKMMMRWMHEQKKQHQQQHIQQQKQLKTMNMMKMKMMMMQKMKLQQQQQQRIYNDNNKTARVVTPTLRSNNATPNQYQNEMRMNRLLLIQNLKQQLQEQEAQCLDDNFEDTFSCSQLQLPPVPKFIIFDRNAIDDDDLSTIVPPEEYVQGGGGSE